MTSTIIFLFARNNYTNESICFILILLNDETQVERVKDGIVRVRQSRYLIDSEKEGKGEESPYGYKWDIYLTYKTNSHNNEVKSKWFTSNDEFVQISVPSGKYFEIKSRIRMKVFTFS